MDQDLDFRTVVEEELKLFDGYLRETLNNDNSRISEIVSHAFKVDGKRIRPTLVLLVAKACGGITPATYHGAVTVELLHTATLIHDDVIDEATMRRGQASVNSVYDNQRSILVGDYLLSNAVLQSVKTDDMDIVRIISELGLKLAEGELNQYTLAKDVIIDEQEYLDVISKKTASLFDACAKIGAVTSGATAESIHQFGLMGHYLGIAFQIRDDIFDYYNKDVGKPTGNDIREGKITLPLIYALRNSSDTNKRDAMQEIIVSKDYSDENIEQLLDFAKAEGGIEYAYGKLFEYLEEAEKEVSKADVPQEYKEVLESMFVYLKERKY